MSYYHIYFNDNKEEIKNKYRIEQEDKVTKIKIIIDNQVTSFRKLFFNCKCIESIKFKKFYRNNITNMSHMFFQCSSLKELNLNNFNTNNVTNMSYMFFGCSDELKMKIRNQGEGKYFLSSSLMFINSPYSPFIGIISNSIDVFVSE